MAVDGIRRNGGGANIGAGAIAQTATQREIEAAASNGGIHEHIAALDQGYDTILSRAFLSDDDEAGTDLSGGQWQKVATARMLARNASFLILDEPTAALDQESEHRILSSLRARSGESTALLISHRFSTIRAADEIAILKNGRLVELGTHEDLVKLNGMYHSMHEKDALSRRLFTG